MSQDRPSFSVMTSLILSLMGDEKTLLRVLKPISCRPLGKQVAPSAISYMPPPRPESRLPHGDK